jgi:hypothetical protein
MLLARALAGSIFLVYSFFTTVAGPARWERIGGVCMTIDFGTRFGQIFSVPQVRARSNRHGPS